LLFLLVDPATGRTLNASSRRPVSVDRKWLTGAHACGSPSCSAVAWRWRPSSSATSTTATSREVSLRAEDGDSGRVSGRDTLAAVTVAMAGARLGHHDVEDETRLRYEEFVRGKRARKEWKARREGMLDLCCSGVGAAAFLGFLVMLTLR